MALKAVSRLAAQGCLKACSLKIAALRMLRSCLQFEDYTFFPHAKVMLRYHSITKESGTSLPWQSTTVAPWHHPVAACSASVYPGPGPGIGT